MALKLLLYVPSHTDAVGIHHELASRLSKELSEKAEVRLATSSDKNVLPSIPQYDIIHIFGCWSNSACNIASKAYATHVPYVFTPLGGLQPWEMERNHKTLLFHRQRRLTIRASAVHLCGKLEQETFAKLGWNGNTCLIKNPVLTSQTTFKQTAVLLSSLYRKVLDTNARLLLGKDEQTAIGKLMQVGIDDKYDSFNEDISKLIEELNGFSDEQWRRIFIYSSEERISDIVLNALDTLQVSHPTVDVSAIERFSGVDKYVDGPLKTDILLTRSLLFRNKVKDVFDGNGKTEQQVCRAIINVAYELNHHSVPMRHLADLYTIIRSTDMDEDLVGDMLRQIKASDTASRLMSVMGDFLGLTEGFMPLPKKKDRKSRAMLNAFTKFGKYKQHN